MLEIIITEFKLYILNKLINEINNKTRQEKNRYLNHFNNCI